MMSSMLTLDRKSKTFLLILPKIVQHVLFRLTVNLFALTEPFKKLFDNVGHAILSRCLEMNAFASSANSLFR